MSAPWLTSPWAYLPAALTALAALYLLFIALLRDRSHKRNPKPHCPKCWYDLSGAYIETNRDHQGAAPPDHPLCVCPECGHAITTPRDLHRTRHRPILALLGLLLLAPLPTLFIHRGDARRTYYALPPKWTTIETLRVGETTATLQRLRNPDDRGCRTTITSRGKSFLTVEDFDIEFGQAKWLPNGLRDTTRVGAGDDLNNDGIKDLVISAFSGGAHCCYTVYVVELSDPPHLAATIDAGNGMSLEPVPTGYPRDDQVRFDVPDQSFCYWNAPYVSSPQPTVKYLLIDHRLRIAPEYMRLSRSAAEVVARSTIESIVTLRSTPHSGPLSDSELDPRMWQVMLQLIYSGNEDEAWSVFAKSWPPSRPGKEAFKQDFLDILNKSAQYRDFKAALEARTSGQPIPPALVGQYTPQSPADPPPKQP